MTGRREARAHEEGPLIAGTTSTRRAPPPPWRLREPAADVDPAPLRARSARGGEVRRRSSQHRQQAGVQVDGSTRFAIRARPSAAMRLSAGTRAASEAAGLATGRPERVNGSSTAGSPPGDSAAETMMSG
jgi:hypothetical protein